ncbi:MAG: acyl-CoA synthetase [Acidimicrobiales bacterium]
MELNFAAIHEAVAAAVPDRECLVWGPRRLSWAEVTDRTRRLARYLHDRGLGVRRPAAELAPWESGQDHLAIYLHNGNEYLECMVGAYKARLAPFNVNYRYVAEELQYLLTDSAAKAIVFHSAFAPTLAEVLGELPRVEVLLQVADDSGNELLPGARWYEEALAVTPAELPAELSAGWSGDDLYIVYTGGTTGMPKGVLWRQADFLLAALGLRRKDGSEYESYDEFAAAAPGSKLRALPAPPFMHGAGHWNAMSCWAAGGTIVLQDHPNRLDGADIWRTVERERASSLLIVGDAFAVPLVDELRRSPGAYDLSGLRFLMTGGAVLSAHLKAAFLELLPTVTVIDVLGSSETGRQGMQTSSAKTGASSGSFAPSANTVVLSEDLTQVLTPGHHEMGWIGQLGRCPRGYLGDQAKTERTFPVIDGVRYAVPGDRGRWMDDGSIELYGRDSVTINSGGEKIFAEEVEQALRTHPAVYDVVVCGRPSSRWGNEVVAVVALRPDAAADDDSLTDAAAQHIARYKLPKAYVYVEQVVRSPSGKADYRWAKEQVSA